MKFIKNLQKTAIVYDDKEINYTELLKKANIFTSLININKGDRVSIFSPNRPELVYSFLAVWAHKGINNPIDFANNADELAYVLKDCTPKYIFTSLEGKERVLEAIEKTGLKIEILVFEELDIENREGEALELDAPEKEDVSLLLYTSGTTGAPKGVMLTFDNVLSQIDSLTKYNMFEGTDRFLTLLPLHHILPLLGSAIVPLYYGATIVFVKELSSEKIKEAFVKYKITLLIGVPRLYEVFHKGIMAKINSSKITKTVFNIAKNIKSEEIRKKIFKKIHEGFGGNVKFFVSGGAKLDEQISKDFCTFGFKMVEGYGMTETSPIICFTKPNNIKPGLAGSPLDSMETKIAEDGELLVKGRNVMKGYYNKPEKTREAIDEDGWLHTGDLAEFDSDNYIRITGRKKEMIVLSNGKNINPAEIESQIMENSNGIIQEIAVVDYNNHLNAIVFPDFNSIESKGITSIKETIKWDIIDKYNNKTSPYKKILNFKIVKQELPKTKLGKLRRFMLKELLVGKNKHREEIKEPNYKEYSLLKQYIKSNTKQNFNPNSHIELDLGFDSLDLVELKAFIDSTFGLDITEEELSGNATVGKLAKFLQEKSTHITEGKNDWSNIFNIKKDLNLPKSSKFLLLVKYLSIPVLKTYFNMKKAGKENIISKPCIFAGNHQSFIDAFMLTASLPNNVLKNTYFLAKVKHFNNKFMKMIANNSNIILVDINKNLKETLMESAQVLKSGKNLVIFPEGIRSRDGELGDFKKAFAILSKELNIPVVPFAVKGSYKSMPVGSKFPKPAKVSLEFLSKIEPKKLEINHIVEKTKKIIKKVL